MSWHRTLANRATSALLGTLMHTVVSDGQTGYRAFSARALAAAGSATTTTTRRCSRCPCGARASTRSRCRSPIAAAPRAAPSCATRSTSPAWRRPSGASGAPRAPRGRRAPPDRPGQPVPQPPPGPKRGKASVSGPNGASGRSVTSEPPPAADVHVEPGRRGQRERREGGADTRRVAQAPGHQRHGQRQRGQQVRGGNQKPNMVGASSPATTSWAPSAAAQRPAVSSISLTPGTARASRSRWARHSHQRPAKASANTGAQRSSP